MARSVHLEGGVDGAGVWKVGTTLPPGLGEDAVKEAGGALRRRSQRRQVSIESELPAEAGFPQQPRKTSAGK